MGAKPACPHSTLYVDLTLYFPWKSRTRHTDLSQMRLLRPPTDRTNVGLYVLTVFFFARTACCLIEPWASVKHNEPLSISTSDGIIAVLKQPPRKYQEIGLSNFVMCMKPRNQYED